MDEAQRLRKLSSPGSDRAIQYSGTPLVERNALDWATRFRGW